MELSKKIKILLAYREMTMADLARELHLSRSAISEKIKRDRWSVADLEEIADVLNSDVKCVFVMRDTGKEI